MKMKQAHWVYLPGQAVELLRLFGSFGDATLNHFFKRLDFGAPDFFPHGTRGAGATLLREYGFGRDVVELLLAHTVAVSMVASASLMLLRSRLLERGPFR
jgi:integrase